MAQVILNAYLDCLGIHCCLKETADVNRYAASHEHQRTLLASETWLAWHASEATITWKAWSTIATRESIASLEAWSTWQTRSTRKA